MMKKAPVPAPYLIQMLFKEPVSMPGKAEMTAVMEKHIGTAECFCHDKKTAGFAALEHMAEFKDVEAPVQLMVMGCSKFKGKGFDAFLMSQMWDCQEDRERIFRECRYQVVATDMLAAAFQFWSGPTWMLTFWRPWRSCIPPVRRSTFRTAASCFWLRMCVLTRSRGRTASSLRVECPFL